MNNISVVDQNKQKLVNKNYSEIIESLKSHREDHKRKINKGSFDLTQAAWVRVNPAPSITKDENSYRLCIGFKNVGCKYREKDTKGLGCLNCGYYATTAFEEVDKDIILTQLINAIKDGYKESIDFNSIELLNDGSFTNYKEFTKDTQEIVFNRIGKMQHVKRVLIESKAEYINSENIIFLLNLLRDEQKLEIGIGFESADDFVRDICINKGFTKRTFEKSIEILSNLGRDYKEKLSIVTYLLVKPAFLSQKEAVEDIVSTLEYLSEISIKYGVEIIPKLEPAAIVDGTILSMLHLDKDSKFHYEALNYWAVLEILARVYLNEKTRLFIDNIRIGAREDMDDIIKVPAIYNENGVFHQFDFVLYEVIQKFNQHHNIFRVFEIIENIFNEFNEFDLFDERSSLMEYYRSSKIDKKRILEFYNTVSYLKNDGDRFNIEQEIDFLKVIYKVLDIIEGYDDSYSDLKNEIIGAINSNDKKELAQMIDKCFNIIDKDKIVEVKIVSIVNINNNCSEVFFDVRDLDRNAKFSLWSMVGLQR